MAVNTQKFLPSSKGGALAKVNKKIINSSTSISLSEKSVKDIGIIRVKVIEIDSILKGTLASEKKKLNEAKKQESSKRREKIEEKLETKPKAESGKIKMPSLPRMGFLDWVKNFIGNVILGYFAVRLVDHLPKIIPIVKFLGKATDFVLDIGGKLLDGLITFIDWGYKAVDFSRGLIGKTFGDEALKNFDKLTSEFEKFMNLAIIVGMASADFGMDRLGRKLTGKGAERAAEKGAGTLARRGVGRAATRAAARVGGKGAAKLTAKVGSKVLKAIPFLGAGLAIAEGIMRIKDGDYVGGLLSFGSAIPVAGWAFLALDIAREFMGGQEFDKSVGRAFSGKTGLTDKQVKQRTPHLSGPSFMGVAGGGMTKKRKPRRTIRRTPPKKVKYKRKLAPQKPGEVEATSPGADVGGEDKLLELFPNPLKFLQKATDAMNPFKVIQSSGKTLGESDYFGPILSITSKILLGQKPTQQDYKNVGLGINMLVAKGIDDGKLRGGLAAFAEGGFVDPKTLDAIAQGGDISDWVAKSFKDATETNAQKTLREIQDNLRLKSSGTKREDDRIDPDQPIDSEDGGYSTNAGDYKELLDLIASKESSSAGGYNAYNEGGSGGGYQVVGYGGDSRKGPLRRALTDMTIKEIMAHQKNVNPPIHAAGRYQIIGSTLAALIKGNYGPTGVSVNDKFSADVQDKLGIALIKYRLKTGATPENFINEWRGLKFVDNRKLQAAINKAQRGRTYRIDVAGTRMDRGGIGGSIAEYITGDPNTPFGRFDKSGHGLPSNYHDHIAFRDRNTAVKAYNFFKSKGIQVTEFKGFDRVGGHATGSLHYSGLAFDVPGAQWGGSGAIGSKDYAGSAKVREILKQFLGEGGLKKLEKGGRVSGPTKALIGEKGTEFVFDADTTRGLDSIAPGLVEKLNFAKTKPQIANILQQYASYESGAEQTVVVPEIQMSDQSQDYDSSSSSSIFMSGSEEESDPFDILYQGG